MLVLGLTVWKSMLHLAMHASPPVPGAMTSGYFLSSEKVDSGTPVAALRTELGIIISDDQMVWVPANTTQKSVSKLNVIEVATATDLLLPRQEASLQSSKATSACAE